MISLQLLQPANAALTRSRDTLSVDSPLRVFAHQRARWSRSKLLTAPGTLSIAHARVKDRGLSVRAFSRDSARRFQPGTRQLGGSRLRYLTCEFADTMQAMTGRMFRVLVIARVRSDYQYVRRVGNHPRRHGNGETRLSGKKPVPRRFSLIP
jgi:hypothetical protein